MSGTTTQSTRDADALMQLASGSRLGARNDVVVVAASALDVIAEALVLFNYDDEDDKSFNARKGDIGQCGVWARLGVLRLVFLVTRFGSASRRTRVSRRRAMSCSQSARNARRVAHCAQHEEH